MDKKLARILDSLPNIEAMIRDMRDIILTNIVMIGEIPAPTYKEDNLRDFVLNRLNQDNLINCSTDESGNALGILPGKSGKKNILVVSHLDSVFEEEENNTLSIQPDYILGRGLSDNIVSLAAIISLPFILDQLKIQLKSNLVIMGTSRSLGPGDLEGIRFFLKNTKLNISNGISVEGVKLGDLSYSSIGMARCEINCWVPEEYDWTKFGAVGSIVTMNELINRIQEIPIPNKPRTNIILSSISGGRGFSSIPLDATLRFEIRSESGEMVDNLQKQIMDIAQEVSSHSGSKVETKVMAKRKPGGISFSHPLASSAREIHKKLGIKSRITPNIAELSAFIDKNIPSVAIGITKTAKQSSSLEKVEIEPLYKGIAQLVGLIMAIDTGCCSEN